MIIVGRENHVSGHFHLLICVPSLDWQLLQVEVYSGKNIFTRCSHQRPFSRYRQLAAYIYCARADYRLIAYFLTFSKLKWITKERDFRFTKSQKHFIGIYYYSPSTIPGAIHALDMDIGACVAWCPDKLSTAEQSTEWQKIWKFQHQSSVHLKCLLSLTGWQLWIGDHDCINDNGFDSFWLFRVSLLNIHFWKEWHNNLYFVIDNCTKRCLQLFILVKHSVNEPEFMTWGCYSVPCSE